MDTLYNKLFSDHVFYSSFYAFVDETSPIHVAKEALQLYQNQFTARWEGLMGDDHVPR